jgi:hypothetical protein
VGISPRGFRYVDIRRLVKGLLDRLGGREMKFKNNFPGEDWLKLFLKPSVKDLTIRLSENMKRARAAISPEVINEYFDNLETT